ncbi:MAG: hypothetical protein H6736_03170 [Alphaproteobacteria bacterium]|nr:hypothetical protein [Alphaproteobacteria bacterium]MCB9690796.1 hypothetical protein [Alphaproteobacteria bacterium]
MSGVPELPTRLPTPAFAVVERLARHGLVVRSVWFPTSAETAAWAASGCPVYIRRLGPRRVEVGPRLEVQWASVFSPVLQLDLGGGEAPELQAHRRFPWLTLGLLALWATIVAGWGLAILVGAAPPAGPFWGVVALGTLAAPVVGWYQGGRALDAGIPWLVEVLLAPDEEEDW